MVFSVVGIEIPAGFNKSDDGSSATVSSSAVKVDLFVKIIIIS